jgi:hypothetical protein
VNNRVLFVKSGVIASPDDDEHIPELTDFVVDSTEISVPNDVKIPELENYVYNDNDNELYKTDIQPVDTDDSESLGGGYVDIQGEYEEDDFIVILSN